MILNNYDTYQTLICLQRFQIELKKHNGKEER